MHFVLIALNLYFALVLIVFGITKLYYPDTTIHLLVKSSLFKPTLARISVLLLSWLEIVLGLILLIYLGPIYIITTYAIATLFVLFLIIKIRLYLISSTLSCGCSGSSSNKPIERLDIFTALLSASLAAFQSYLSPQIELIDWNWRLISFVPIIILTLVLLGKVYLYRLNFDRKHNKGTM
jgi:Methylamine utilisation protein MauE